MPGWIARRTVLAAAAAAAVALVAGLASGLLAARPQPPAHPAARLPSAHPVVAAASPTPTADAWWTPLPPATAAFEPAELVIEKLRVRAPIEVKGIDAHNVMEAPDRGTDAAWYRFTAQPGAGSNAVFAGHRDFGQVGNPAIFWHLDQLMAGDLVEIVSAQRTEIRYRVTQTWDYTLTDIPMAKVLATDRTDEVTLITCAGSYSRGVGYDRRLVVRAVRV
ncbi:MAG TPA: class F sortase [Candidatus Dormibacteraeota bacterium]|jgi:LPXTG-site transpeptidase (sortase) family protein